MLESQFNDEFGITFSCTKLIMLIAMYSLISLDIILCIIIFGLEFYLEDNARRFKQFFVYASVICILILNCIQVFLLFKKHKKHIFTIMLMYLYNQQIIIAFAFVAYYSDYSLQYFIYQKIHSKKMVACSGKVPIVDPHTQIWYQIASTNTILAYLLAGLSLIQEILVYFSIKKPVIRHSQIFSLMKEDRDLSIHQPADIQDRQLVKKSKVSSNAENFVNTVPSKHQKIFDQSDQSLTSEEQLIENQEQTESLAKSWKNSVNSFYEKKL